LVKPSREGFVENNADSPNCDQYHAHFFHHYPKKTQKQTDSLDSGLFRRLYAALLGLFYKIIPLLDSLSRALKP